MRKLLLGLCLILLLTVPSLADNIDDQALSIARTFAALVDDENFQAAYWSGSPLLHLANAEQAWLNKTARTQQVLGKVLERELKKIRSVTSPADMPDDDYRIILFDARTEHKAKAAEVILVHPVDGIWQVCDYSIR